MLVLARSKLTVFLGSKTNQGGEHLHWLHFVEADDLILRHLESELGSEPHERITVGLQSTGKTGARFIHHGSSNIYENGSISCLPTSSMRCPEKHNPYSLFVDRLVSRLDPRLEQCLKRRMLDW